MKSVIMRKFAVVKHAQSAGGVNRTRALAIERMVNGLTYRTPTRDVHMITAIRKSCHVCKSRNLDEAFVGPWVVCTDCRQLQSRYEQREPTPEELPKGHGQGPRGYNLRGDMSELE